MGSVPKQVVAAVITRDGDSGTAEIEVFICQRAAGSPMPLKWEFPGGKVEPNEDPRDALRRELREELRIDAKVGRKLAVVRHEYKDGFFVELLFYGISSYEHEITNEIFEDVRWEKLSKLSSYDFLEADVVFIRDLAAGHFAL